MAERRHGGRRGDARGGGRGGGRGDLPNEEAARQCDLRDIENDDLRQQVLDLQHDTKNGDMRQQRNAAVRELNLQLGHMLSEVESERKRGESLDAMRKANQSHYWWESPIGKLGLEELEQVKEAMQELKKNVNREAAKLAVYAAGRGGVFEQYETKPSHGGVGSRLEDINKNVKREATKLVNSLANAVYELFG
ncbi:hypothetical protein SASPL_134278 [Salvia splendens]|uniref:Uncharacterized protein n=1 Tax=Salvia splendens TaxID=180675 RepID=A0A8X8X481_SALSN|nr:hypothetical protein SASPL_134278 [Salvia splendens]